METWPTEIRSPDGEWLGVVDAVTPPEMRRLILPVRTPFTATFALDEAPALCSFETVSLDRSLWCDGSGRVAAIWQFTGSRHLLQRASRVYVRGSVERTKVGELLDYRDAMMQLIWLVRLHKMPVQTIH